MLPETEAERIEKYCFDDFDLLPKQRLLLREGARIPLTPRPLATLLLLVERSGQTVSKEELFARVWNGASVEENNLTQSISTLRRALGEKRGENRYIATDPGRGYRFVAPVSLMLEKAAEAQESEPVEKTEPSRFGGRARLLVLIVGIVLLAAGLAVWLRMYSAEASAPSRQSIAVLRVRDLSKTSTESWLQTALPEMLTSELAAGGKLRTIPAEDVVRWRADLGPAADDAIADGLCFIPRKTISGRTLLFWVLMS